MRNHGLLLVSALIIAILAGCGAATKSPEQTSKKEGTGAPAPAAGKGTSHSHVAPHGGQIQSVENYHLEVVYDSKNGGITLYVLGEDESKAFQTDAQAFKVQAKVEGLDDLFEMEMRPIPQDGEKQGMSSRFYGSLPELMSAKSFEMVLRIPLQGKTYRTTFQVVPGDKKDVYVCAMGCEKDKVYYAPGKCPVCKMELIHPKEAHADHAPKHGGQFFMAPDHWHHLEGVMLNPKEIRVYFYNNFTKPIPAKPFVGASYAEIVQLDEKKNEVGKAMKASFVEGKDGEFLTLTMPDGLALPISVTARVKFEGKDRPEVFNFVFERVVEEREHASR